MKRLDPIEELYDMYLEEEDSPRIVKVDSVPGPELSQLPSKSVLTKKT